MKSYLYLIAAVLPLCWASCAQEEGCVETPVAIEENTPEETYDSTYAASLEADEYGMHRYVMAILKEGPNRSQSEEEAAKLQRAHLDNIIRMANEGKLLVAGPFLDEGDNKGIYIFNVETVEEARALTETDPAIKAGSLVMELHPWYGPASLPEIFKMQKKITKTQI